MAETLESACAQRGADIEILISDDGSNDSSLDIVRQYAARDARIRICENKQNRGLVGNWNFCIQEARGEWIKFLFQDDLLLPQYMERVRPYLDGECPFIVNHRRQQVEPGTAPEFAKLYDDLISLPAISPMEGHISAEDFSWVLANFQVYNFIGEPSNTIFRRNVVETLGFFHPGMHQIADLEYWARLGCNFGVVSIPEVLSIFRVHKSSTSAKNSETSNFKTHGLDVLILAHDYCYAPWFHNIRVAATGKGLSLTSFCGIYLQRADHDVSVMEQRGLDKQILDDSIYKPWATVCALYPMIWNTLKAVLPHRVSLLQQYLPRELL